VAPCSLSRDDLSPLVARRINQHQRARSEPLSPATASMTRLRCSGNGPSRQFDDWRRTDGRTRPEASREVSRRWTEPNCETDQRQLGRRSFQLAPTVGPPLTRGEVSISLTPRCPPTERRTRDDVRGRERTNEPTSAAARLERTTATVFCSLIAHARSRVRPPRCGTRKDSRPICTDRDGLWLFIRVSSSRRSVVTANYLLRP